MRRGFPLGTPILISGREEERVAVETFEHDSEHVCLVDQLVLRHEHVPHDVWVGDHDLDLSDKVEKHDRVLGSIVASLFAGSIQLVKRPVESRLDDLFAGFLTFEAQFLPFAHDADVA